VRPLTHPSDVLDAAITPDGRFALTATHGRPNTNGAVRLWDLGTGNFAFRPFSGGHTGPVRAVAFLPNNRALSGGQDGHLILWNLMRGRPIGTLGRHEGLIHRHCIAVFPDGRRALTGGKDRLVHVWNLAMGKETGRWEGHNGLICDIAISPNGRRAVTGGHDRSVILWDVATGSPVHRFSLPDGDNMPSAAILPDGNILAAGGVVGHLVLWDGRTFAILRQAQPPFFPHGDLAVMPDGQRGLTGDADGVVRLWTPREP
jgi:WD40 repeat protein